MNWNPKTVGAGIGLAATLTLGAAPAVLTTATAAAPAAATAGATSGPNMHYEVTLTAVAVPACAKMHYEGCSAITALPGTHVTRVLTMRLAGGAKDKMHYEAIPA